ncbi:MAG: hypothetical protein V1909_05485 [Candidatus Micrarchaeota archaeon]
MRVAKILPSVLVLLTLANQSYSQTMDPPQEIATVRLIALLLGIIAAGMSWKWYFSTISKPPVLLWLGIGMVSELIIKWLNLSLNPTANTSADLIIATLQVASAACFLKGLWAFLCTRWVKAKSTLSNYFLLFLLFIIILLLGYGVMNGQSGNQSLIIYSIYVLTAFWMLLYIFITLMALYAYIRTDEMMLAWFSAGFSMMVFTSWYRLIYFQSSMLPDQVFVSSLLPLINSVCYIVGVFLFQRAGKA